MSSGIHITKKAAIVEADCAKAAFDESGELLAVFNITPFDSLVAKEEADEIAEYIKKAQIESIRRLLVYVFGEKATPLEALQKLSIICYCVAPDLIEGCNLEKIAKEFDFTKQAFSKRLLKINKELNIRGRNQKSDYSREVYAKNTKAFHKARKAEEKATEDLKKAKKHRKKD